MKNKKSTLYRFAETLITAFIIGNSIAFIMGAAPISFPTHQFLPEEQKSIEVLSKLRDENPDVPEYPIALSTLYFLANQLDEAENILTTVPQEYIADDNFKLISNAISIKRSGEMLDLLFGQVKLYRLNQSVDEIYTIAQKTPTIDTQLMVLSTLSELTDVGDSEEKGLVIAENVEKQLPNLESQGALPVDLGVSVYQSLSNMYLVVIRNNMQKDKDYQNLAATALKKYDDFYAQIKNKPGWLTEGHDLVESRRRYLEL